MAGERSGKVLDGSGAPKAPSSLGCGRHWEPWSQPHQPGGSGVQSLETVWLHHPLSDLPRFPSVDTNPAPGIRGCPSTQPPSLLGRGHQLHLVDKDVETGWLWPLKVTASLDYAGFFLSTHVCRLQVSGQTPPPTRALGFTDRSLPHCCQRGHLQSPLPTTVLPPTLHHTEPLP